MSTQCEAITRDGRYRCELVAGHPGYHEERAGHPRGAVRYWGTTARRSCASCNGTGEDWPEYPDDPCPNCGGSGEVEYIPIVIKRRKQEEKP